MSDVIDQTIWYWDEKPDVMPDGDWVLYTTLKR